MGNHRRIGIDQLTEREAIISSLFTRLIPLNRDREVAPTKSYTFEDSCRLGFAMGTLWELCRLPCPVDRSVDATESRPGGRSYQVLYL